MQNRKQQIWETVYTLYRKHDADNEDRVNMTTDIVWMHVKDYPDLEVTEFTVIQILLEYTPQLVKEYDKLNRELNEMFAVFDEIREEHLEMAYLVRRKDYLREDAKNKILEKFNYDIYKPEYDKENLLARKNFKEKYGVELMDIVDLESDDCILDDIVYKFEKYDNSDVAVNLTWDLAIEKTLQELLINQYA